MIAKRKIHHEIEKLAKRLPEPVNLYAGVQPVLSALPENVLQFLRHNERYMLVNKPFSHHRFVLTACLKGPGYIIVDGEMYRIEPGQGMLVFPYQNHHWTRFEHPAGISWLFTTFEYRVPEELEPLRGTPFTFEESDLERLLRMLRISCRSFRQGRNVRSEMPMEAGLLLSGLLQRQHRYIKRAGGKLLPDAADVKFLKPLFAFMHRNLKGPIDISGIADCVHLSPSRLRARFKHALGISLGNFIRRTRIHKACGLLHSTDRSVSEIAEECGFDSVYSFSRAFHQVVGKPPRNFRIDIRG